MRKILGFFIVLLLLPNIAFCDGMFNNGGVFSKGGSGSGSGNVGIGTVGIIAAYTASTTVGTLAPPTACPGGQYSRGIDNTGNSVGCTVAGGTAAAAGNTNAVQYNSGSSTFAGDETKFSFNATNIGIGTTNGLSLLDIRGGNVGIGTFGTNHSILEVTGNGANELLRLNDSGQNDITPFVVTKVGNVGIGTSSASSALRVVGTTNTDALTVTGTSTQAAINESGLLDNTAGQIRIRAGSPNDQILFTASNKPIIQTSSDSGTTADIQFIVNGGTNLVETAAGNVGVGTVGPTHLFGVGTADSFNINSAGAVGAVSGSFSGNVGINGAGITDNLKITASTNSGIIMNGVGPTYIQENQPSGTGNSANLTAGNLNIRSVGSTETYNLGPYIITGGDVIDNGAGIWLRGDNSGSGGNIDLMNNAFDGIIINASGNVGVGSAMPATFTPTFQSKLYVNGNITATGLGTAGTKCVHVDNNGLMSTTAADCGSGGGTAAGGTKAVQYNSGSSTFAGSEANFSFDGINVGIGTSTPNNALDVFGGVGISKTANSTFITSSPSAGSVQIEGNVGIGTTLMQQASLTVMNGNVGIGTWIPGAALSIVGNGPVLLPTNVGIGSATPGGQLDVGGKFRITAGGNLITSGTAPTIAGNACGTTVQGTVTAKSTNNAGSFTVGTLAVTACAVTFNTAVAYVNAPFCVVSVDSNIISVKPTTTTTTLTVTATGSFSGDVVSYICVGGE